MEPDDILPDIPLEAQGKVMLFNGTTCSICGFRYAEHEGHIIPCPRCAVADLERRVENAKANWEGSREAHQASGDALEEITKYAHDLESRLAQAEADCDTWKANQRQALKERDEGYRLWKEAEAREAAMREAAEMLCVVLANVSGGDWKQQSDEWQQAAARWRDNYFAALSPDAAHALAAKAEKLQEVARVLQNTTPEALRQLVTELFTQGRSAWAYLFTDLATALDALGKRGKEGE